MSIDSNAQPSAQRQPEFIDPKQRPPAAAPDALYRRVPQGIHFSKSTFGQKEQSSLQSDSIQPHIEDTLANQYYSKSAVPERVDEEDRDQENKRRRPSLGREKASRRRSSGSLRKSSKTRLSTSRERRRIATQKSGSIGESRGSTQRLPAQSNQRARDQPEELGADSVREIYGQLKQKSGQLNALLEQLSKIVDV